MGDTTKHKTLREKAMIKETRVHTSGLAVVLLFGLWVFAAGLTGGPQAHASMGIGPGAALYVLSEDEIPKTLEKSGACPGFDCPEEGEGEGEGEGDPADFPTADFEASPSCSGRYPLTVDFVNTSQPAANTPEVPIAASCWYFGFGDGEYSAETSPSRMFTHFGQFFIQLRVKDANGVCSPVITRYVTSQLFKPTTDDVQYLSDLELMTGIREMITRHGVLHPERSDFVFGTAELDGQWYGIPLQYRPKPPLPDVCPDPCPFEGESLCEGEAMCLDMNRDWTCVGNPCDPQNLEHTYCCSDPRSFSPPYGGEEGQSGSVNCPEEPDVDPEDPLPSDPLPLRNEDIMAYVRREFNTLYTANSLCEPAVARRGVWNAATETYDVDYNFTLFDAVMAAREDPVNPEMDLDMFGVFFVYWLPAWAAYGSGLGRLTYSNLPGKIDEYIDSVINHCNPAQGEHPFKHWAVANEVISGPEEGLTAENCENLNYIIKTHYSLRSAPATGADTKLDDKFWWPWYVISEKGTNSARALSALKNCYINAKDKDPEARVVLNDYGLEFRYGTYTEPYLVYTQIEQPKYKAARKLIEEFQNNDVPLDDIGLQTHLAAWQFLAYDTTSGDENGLRLSRAQLINIQHSVKGFGELGLGVILSEIDIRIGIPDPNYSEHTSITIHLINANNWITLPLSDRRTWQGKVYEAMLNACLAEPALHGINFWGICDETNWLSLYANPTSWPYMPGYLMPGSETGDPSCQASLFGRQLGAEQSYFDYRRAMFYPKPAYWGVRNAMTNYFGTAYTVRSFAGEELVRFVENGNVLLMKENAQAHTGVTNWPALETVRLAIMNSNCEQVAAITEAGDLYLKGIVDQRKNETDIEQAQAVFEIQRPGDNEVVSLIDYDGNLLIRDTSTAGTGGESNPRTGYLLIHGIPYDLDPSQCPNCANDFYSCK